MTLLLGFWLFAKHQPTYHLLKKRNSGALLFSGCVFLSIILGIGLLIFYAGLVWAVEPGLIMLVAFGIYVFLVALLIPIALRGFRVCAAHQEKA